MKYEVINYVFGSGGSDGNNNIGCSKFLLYSHSLFDNTPARMVFALRKGLLQVVIGLALLFTPTSAARKLSNANAIATSNDPDVLEMNEYILSYNRRLAVVEEEVKIKDKGKAQQKETVHIEAEEKDTPKEKAQDGNDHIFPGIPNFENGGIFVYFHLYKTGGSSLTSLMQHFQYDEDDDEDEIYPFSMIWNRRSMTMKDAKIATETAKNSKKATIHIFHVEFPSIMYPTLVEAAPILDEWREHANAEGVPFFVATTLREPLGQALSFFNFFHVACKDEYWSPFTGGMEPTEENFLKTYVPNRMCHLMYNDAHGILEAPDAALVAGLSENLFHFMDDDEINQRNEPSNCDIEKVRNILFFGTTFDYVGITDNLTTHILPMVTKILFGDAMLGADAVRRKEADKMNDDETVIPLRKKDLSESTIEKIKQESKLDQQLYEEARDRFAHWPSPITPSMLRRRSRRMSETEEDEKSRTTNNIMNGELPEMDEEDDEEL
jgi:hypothetical protein